MKAYYKYYKIAGIVYQIVSPFEFFKENDVNQAFEVEEQPADFVFTFEHITDITPFFKDDFKMVHSADWIDIYLDQDNTEHSFFKSGPIYMAVTVQKEDEPSAICYYLDDVLMKKRMEIGCMPLSYIRIEKGLMMKQALLLHSCHIQYGNKSILFSAPSGTGKSTQGELWRQYANADVINGDRTVVRKLDGRWMACGVPMNGTSGISQNKNAPLGAIVVLRQAKTDNIVLEKGYQAFYHIYSEIILNTWDKCFVEMASGQIMEMMEEVPIYYFECTKEESAVTVLKQKLKEDGVID